MNGTRKQPVAFFSRKLTPAQTRYPASDLEALCITEVFEEYRSILYGAPILVRTDHKNLTAQNLRSHRLLHWRLLLEEFAPRFEHLPGKENVVGDSLSRLPLASSERQDADEIESRLQDCFLFYPEDVEKFPLTFENIAEIQQADKTLLPLADKDDYEIKMFGGVELICRHHQDRWKIVLPEALAKTTIAWYHNVLGHVGINRLVTSLLSHLWIDNAKKFVTDYVSTCDQCQRNKRSGPGYGEIPPKNEVDNLWDTVAVDCIGPWTLRLPTGIIKVHAITMVDITSTLSEIKRLENKTSDHCAMHFENEWLARYPKPMRCLHDQGTEFMGMAFQHMLAMNGIKSVPISVRNPQANAVCERLHQTVGDMLQTSLRSPPDNVATAVELVDACLAAASRAMRSIVHQTLQVSPGALIFGRDMLLPIPILADYNLIRERRQAVIDENNRKENLRRRFKDYKTGDQVLLMLNPMGKLGVRTMGPYKIIQVHVNGTVTIERGPSVFERVNIRQVKPYNARLPGTATDGAAVDV
jgi:transposase InsO family protein